MHDKLIIPRRNQSEETTPESLKGVIIGATGKVGIACAYSMLIQHTFDELVLIGRDQDRLGGEVMDLIHGVPLLEPVKVRAGSYADCEAADVIIITAGVAQRSGESRLNLVKRNVEIYKEIIPNVINCCPNAILLIVTNPVDIMTYVALKISGLPANHVLGTGTVLDSARFTHLLAEYAGVDPRSSYAYIIGEHGDTSVPVWSQASLAGTLLYSDHAAPVDASDSAAMQSIYEDVKNAAYEVIKRKGSTSYAIGITTTHIVQSILRNHNRVLTVSSLLEGIYGLDEICLGFPAIVNRFGAESLINLPLSEHEQELLHKSAEQIRNVLDELDLS